MFVSVRFVAGHDDAILEPGVLEDCRVGLAAQTDIDHALDVVEMLVAARYRRAERRARLEAANLTLERMRHLFRLAQGAGACPFKVFETSMRALDECGRMLHGWRQGIGGGETSP